MSDRDPVIYGMPQTVKLPVGDIGIGSYIINDYLLTVAEDEDGNGYLLTIKKGSEVQTIHLTELTQEAVNSSIETALSQAKESGEFDGNGIESVVFNPDYTLSLYFTDETSVTTGSIRGKEGNGIQGIEMNPDHTLTITFTDGNTFTTEPVKGETGNGIAGVTLNPDYTLTISYTNGTSMTTGSIRGEKGDAGNGISAIAFNDDYTLTITYTDGSSYRTESIRGLKGETGTGVKSTELNSDYTLTINLDDGTSYTTPSIRGAKGDKGDKGDPGDSFEYHICSSVEYDHETRVPTVPYPKKNVLYLVPSEEGYPTDLFVEWNYIIDHWEKFGSASINLDDYAKKTDVAKKLDKPTRDGLQGQVLTSDGSGGQTWSNSTTPDWNAASGVAGFIRNKPDLKAGTGSDSIANRHSIVSGTHSMATGTNNIVSGADNYVTGSGNNAKGTASMLAGDHNTTELRGSNSLVGGSGNSVSNGNAIVAGSNNTASGLNATVNGSGNTVSGANAFAVGEGNTVSGTASTAAGITSKASGNYSFATGKGTEASGEASFACGESSKASGVYSHAEGNAAIAIGNSSHAEGGTMSAAIYVTGEANTKTYSISRQVGPDYIKKSLQYGRSCVYYNDKIINIESVNSELTSITFETTLSDTDITDQLVMFYANSVAYGRSSHSEGSSCTYGDYSHAEGTMSLALGSSSHAEGQNTKASGGAAHAEGNNTTAIGSNSHSEGTSTIANHKSQSVSGEFNVEDDSSAAPTKRGTYIEIVGNGANKNARSNARTLDWSGNEWLAGNLKVGGTGYDDANAKEVIQDVTVNGVSVANNGVAEIPIASDTFAGTVKIKPETGIYLTDDEYLSIVPANSYYIKRGTNNSFPITSLLINEATFYGLAKAAGDTTQYASTNAVGTYTDNAKASIKAMLGVGGETQKVTVSGTAPVIVANQNTRYVCDEVVSLDFTPSAEGICDVIFTSGSTVTVLTIPNTVRFPEWFDPATLEANKTYEISVSDGVYGAVMVW